MASAEKNRPEVSVIIPVFNDQVGLDACLAALGQQTYPDERLEVIVVDNGSDLPIRISDKPAFRASVITCGTPGSYAARNAGIEAAGGDVLAFTDADCIPDPGWLENGVEALGRAGDNRIVGGDVKMRLSETPTAVELYQGVTGFEQRENIEQRGFTVTANLFVRREAMRDIGPFDTSLLSGGDLEWSRRATANGYALVFAVGAIVETLPRTSLRSAARQARRVAGGRKAMRSEEEGGVIGPVGPRRGALASVRWILGHPELGLRDRVRVLFVAMYLYAVRVLENLRLALGREPERR